MIYYVLSQNQRRRWRRTREERCVEEGGPDRLSRDLGGSHTREPTAIPAPADSRAAAAAPRHPASPGPQPAAGRPGARPARGGGGRPASRDDSVLIEVIGAVMAPHPLRTPLE